MTASYMCVRLGYEIHWNVIYKDEYLMYGYSNHNNFTNTHIAQFNWIDKFIVCELNILFLANDKHRLLWVWNVIFYLKSRYVGFTNNLMLRLLRRISIIQEWPSLWYFLPSLVSHHPLCSFPGSESVVCVHAPSQLILRTTVTGCWTLVVVAVAGNNSEVVTRQSWPSSTRHQPSQLRLG